MVDDGSIDKTAEIIHTFTDPRIRYVYQENKGQASALNHGLTLAVGEYITTLDTDDWYTPDHLISRVSFMEKHPELGVVYGDGYYCNVAGIPLKRFAENRIGDVVGDVYDTLITSPFFATGANVLVRRRVFEEHQIYYDESIVWCQDWDIYIRIAEVAKFGLIDQTTLWYRMHETNMTMSMPQGRRLESLIRTKNKALASPRFTTASTSLKAAFFFQFLTRDLHGQLEEQMTVLESAQFQNLPKPQQARLMRITANNYLLEGSHMEFVRDCLKRAWLLAPFDTKTLLMVLLGNLNIRLIKFIVRFWRRFRIKTNASPSVIEMAKN